MASQQAAVRAAPQPRVQPAPIFAIASGKGGVGKTWLSVSLACAFARASRRSLLVDCDLGLANIDVQIGVRPQADLHSITRGWIDLDAAVSPVLGGAGNSGGFDFIAGHSGSGALAALKIEEVLKVCEGVRKMAPHYDRILMDLAAGVDPTVIKFARSADRLVLVVTEEPTSLTDAYALAKLLKINGSTLIPSVVVNIAENRTRGRRVYDQFALACEEYLGYRPKLAGVIARDPRVADAIRAQVPLSVRHPQSQAFEDVLRVAEALNAE